MDYYYIEESPTRRDTALRFFDEMTSTSRRSLSSKTLSTLDPADRQLEEGFNRLPWLMVAALSLLPLLIF